MFNSLLKVVCFNGNVKAALSSCDNKRMAILFSICFIFPICVSDISIVVQLLLLDMSFWWLTNVSSVTLIIILYCSIYTAQELEQEQRR